MQVSVRTVASLCWIEEHSLIYTIRQTIHYSPHQLLCIASLTDSWWPQLFRTPWASILVAPLLPLYSSDSFKSALCKFKQGQIFSPLLSFFDIKTSARRDLTWSSQSYIFSYARRALWASCRLVRPIQDRGVNADCTTWTGGRLHEPISR